MVNKSTYVTPSTGILAEVVEVEAAQQAKPCKKSRCSAVQDLVIAREVASAKAQTPQYGETKKRFEQAALKCKNHEAFKDEPITWKPFQDRYKRLQEIYSELDDGNQRLSGVGGGEMGELADLLMTTREAKDDFDSQKKAVQASERKKKEDKERMGAALVQAATKRRSSSGSEEGSEDAEEDEASGEDGAKDKIAARKRKKQRTSPSKVAATEMDRFGLHLKEADLARIELEREKLVFEQNKSIADRLEQENVREEEREERRADCEERREERIEHAKLEWENHKALLELLAKHK